MPPPAPSPGRLPRRDGPGRGALRPRPAAEEQAAERDLHDDQEHPVEQHPGHRLHRVDADGDQPGDGADLGDTGAAGGDRHQGPEAFDGGGGQHQDQGYVEPDRLEREVEQRHLGRDVRRAGRQQPVPLAGEQALDPLGRLLDPGQEPRGPRAARPAAGRCGGPQHRPHRSREQHHARARGAHPPQHHRHVHAQGDQGRDRDQRQQQLGEHVEGVGEQGEGDEGAVRVPPGAHHPPVEGGGHRSSQGQHVRDRAAAQVEQQAAAYAEAGQGRRQHQRVDAEPAEPDAGQGQQPHRRDAAQHRGHLRPSWSRPPRASPSRGRRCRWPAPAPPSTPTGTSAGRSPSPYSSGLPRLHHQAAQRDPDHGDQHAGDVVDDEVPAEVDGGHDGAGQEDPERVAGRGAGRSTGPSAAAGRSPRRAGWRTPTPARTRPRPAGGRAGAPAAPCTAPGCPGPSCAGRSANWAGSESNGPRDGIR